MQVSWIDPDEISKLAAQLEGPLQREETAPWDLDTLPDFSNLFAMDEPEVAAPADLANAMAAPAPEPMEQQGAAPAPEIEHIREKLRAIRSRAQNAGLLPPERKPLPSPEQPPPSEQAELARAIATASSRPPVRIPPAPVAAVEPVTTSSPAPTPFLALDGSLTERLQKFMPWAKSLAPCDDVLLVDDHGDLLWGDPSRADLALSVVLAAGAGLRSGSEALTRSSVFIRSRLGEQKELSVLPCPTLYGMVTLALLNATSLTNETVACLREALTLCIDGSALPATKGGPPATSRVVT